MLHTANGTGMKTTCILPNGGGGFSMSLVREGLIQQASRCPAPLHNLHLNEPSPSFSFQMIPKHLSVHGNTSALEACSSREEAVLFQMPEIDCKWFWLRDIKMKIKRRIMKHKLTFNG